MLQYGSDETSEVSFMYRPPPGYMATREPKPEAEKGEDDQVRGLSFLFLHGIPLMTITP